MIVDPEKRLQHFYFIRASILLFACGWLMPLQAAASVHTEEDSLGSIESLLDGGIASDAGSIFVAQSQMDEVGLFAADEPVLTSDPRFEIGQILAQPRGSWLPILPPKAVASHFARFAYRSPSKSENRGRSKIKDAVAQASKASLPPPIVSDLPLASHPLVDQYRSYFLGSGRRVFTRWLQRLDRLGPKIRSILKEEGLPQDLVYLALIESGLRSQAHSSAAAVGYWQFLAPTGRENGLKINSWLDQRRNLERSTRAAARFLTHLHRRFRDWHLACAAYNAGAGRVTRALRRHNVESFWQLHQHKGLARETLHYVPKLIAALSIAKNREHYGFGAASLEHKDTEWDILKVQGAVALRSLARGLKLSERDFLRAHSEYILATTPPYGEHLLRVPKGRVKQAQAWLKNHRPKTPEAFVRHRLKAGETLYGLARRYKTQSKEIAQYNGIRSPRLLRPGRVLLIPQNVSLRPKKAKKGSYTVGQGDTLWSIARRHGLAVATLKRLNRGLSKVIRPGDVLSLR